MHILTRIRVVPFLLLAIPLNAASNATAPLRIHGGTVVVRSKLHAMIFLARNGDGDGPVEHLFQLWSNPGLALNATYRGADVEYNGSSLVVVVPYTKTANIFTVRGYPPPSTPIPEGFSTGSFEIFGLNHQTGLEEHMIRTGGSGRITPHECTDCDWLVFEDPWGATGGSGNCTSGGPYATSCSQSGAGGSCSVTCSTGNGGYACCVAGSPPTCTCKLY